MIKAVIASLIVVGLFFVLCGFYRNISDNPYVSRCVKVQLDLSAIAEALESIKRVDGYYPSTRDGLSALVQKYKLMRLPKDPWNNDYFYRFPSELKSDYEYNLMSFGENGINDNGALDDYVFGKPADCSKYEISCLTFALKTGVIFFLIILILVNRKSLFSIVQRKE